MIKWIKTGFALALVVVLFGCGQVTKQTQAQRPTHSQTPGSPAVATTEVVIARSNMILNIGAGVNTLSVANNLTSSSVQIVNDVNLVVPPMTTFAVNNNLSFNVNKLALIEADGALNISLFYNQLTETNISRVYVRARFIDSSGLCGKTATQSLIPVDIKVTGGNYSPLNTTNLVLNEWTKPFSAAISSNIELKLRGNFAGALAQQYKGTIVLELVKETAVQSWSLLTNSPPWSARLEAKSVVFNNKIWVVCGEYPSDVWCSSDGSSWTQTAGTSFLGYRRSPSCVVFDNKLWIMGGCYPYKNDVWCSEDGSAWTQVTAAAPWSARLGQNSVVFDNKIWIMGGYEAGGWVNDVWSSPDGINWTKAGNAPWSGRIAHGSVVFDDKIWVIGGVGLNGRNNDVWYSSDGTNWTQAGNAPWTARNMNSCVVYDNKIWILTGYDDLVGNITDVWYTSDGLNWTRSINNVPAGSHSNNSVVFNGDLIFLDYANNDVWSL